MSKNFIPNLNDGERKRMTTTLEQLSRNSAIRVEIIHKRKNGCTVENACRSVGDDFNLSPERVRNIYYSN